MLTKKKKKIMNSVFNKLIEILFLKDINNCLAINPGRLATTPAVGTNGTFARMVISPSNEETSLYNYVACQVLKV